MLALLSIAAPVAAAVPPAAAPAETVELDGAELRIGDLAGLEGFAPLLRLRPGSTVVAALPEGRTVVTTRSALAGLVRRSAPGLVFDVADGAGPVTIRRRGPAASHRRPGACAALVAPVVAGAAIGGTDVEEAPCDGEAGAAQVRFDRAAGVLRAAADLDAGAYLGRIALPTESAVAPGAELTLVSTVGPVTIARPVVAMQSGRRGGRLFVRDEDGQVFAVRLDDRSEAGQ